MPQFTLDIEGTETTVDLTSEQLADAGFIALTEVEKKYVPSKNVKKTIMSRLAGEEERLRKVFLDDAEFAKEILTNAGVPLDEDGNPNMPEGGLTAAEVKTQLDEARKKAEESIRSREIEPLKKTNTTLASENESLRKSRLVTNILEYARIFGVKKDLREPVIPGAPLETAPIVSQLMPRFTWDAETRDWVQFTKDDEDRQTLIVSTKENRQYAGIEELFESFQDKPEVRKRVFEDERPDTTNLGDVGTRNGRGANVINRAVFDKMNDGQRSAFFAKGGKVED